MNKTISNRKIFDKIEKELNNNHVYIKSKTYSDDINKIKDSVIEFKVKGLRKWLFTCAICNRHGICNMKEIRIATRYKRFINKFNYEHIVFRTSVDIYSNEDKYIKASNEECLIDIAKTVAKMVKYIKHHPIKAYDTDTDVFSEEWRDRDFKATRMLYETSKDKFYSLANTVLYWYIHRKLSNLAKKNRIRAVYDNESCPIRGLEHNDNIYYVYAKNENDYKSLEKFFDKIRNCYFLYLGKFILTNDESQFQNYIMKLLYKITL